MTKDIYSFVKVSARIEDVYEYLISLNPLFIFEGVAGTPLYVDRLFFKPEYAKKNRKILIDFEDGSTAICHLEDFTPHNSFSFHFSHFTSLRFLGLETVHSSFSFSEWGDEKTIVNCHYRLLMQSPFWNFIFEYFLRSTLQKNLDRILIQTAKDLKFFNDWRLTLK